MNIVFFHHNCTMKYESSISSSFPFNKTSAHFIFEEILDLNYFDFFWPNFCECFKRESEMLLKPTQEIKGCVLGDFVLIFSSLFQYRSFAFRSGSIDSRTWLQEAQILHPLMELLFKT